MTAKKINEPEEVIKPVEPVDSVTADDEDEIEFDETQEDDDVDEDESEEDK